LGKSSIKEEVHSREFTTGRFIIEPSTIIKKFPQVDQEVFWQIADRVPWAHPSTLKGYICKAVADADAGVFGND